MAGKVGAGLSSADVPQTGCCQPLPGEVRALEPRKCLCGGRYHLSGGS